MHVGAIIGIVCGGFLFTALVVWGGIYCCYRYNWFEGYFGGVGEEVRGLPLQARAPRLSEEGRRQRERWKRRVARRRQRQMERSAAAGNNNDSNDGNGNDDDTESEAGRRTPDSNSRWFRRFSDTSTVTTATIASSGAVYGRGNYLSVRSAATHGASPGDDEAKRRAARRRHRRRRAPHGGDEEEERAFGGWTESDTASGGSSYTTEPEGEVVGVNESEEPRTQPRRVAIGQSATISGFFAAPPARQGTEPFGGPEPS